VRQAVWSLRRSNGDEAPSADKALGRLETAFLSKRRSEPVVLDDPRISGALAWLKDCRLAEGYWGSKNVAVTSLSALAIAGWRRNAPKGLRKTVAWLNEAQDYDGSWKSVWDTAVTFQALLEAQQAREAAAQRAFQFLVDLTPDRNPGWSDSLHFPAQVLIALDRAGVERDALHPWRDFILEHLGTKHGWYVRGQAIYALASTHTADTDQIDDQVTELEKYLEHGAISEPEFLQWTPTLQALSVTSGNKELIQEKAGVLLSEVREDGSWYTEPRHTAWALLALNTVKVATEIAVDYASFAAYIRAAKSELDEARKVEIANRRRAGGAGALAAAALAGLIALVVLWNDAQSILISGIALTVLLSVLGVSARTLWRIIR
jgi:hypothetical protein